MGNGPLAQMLPALAGGNPQLNLGTMNPEMSGKDQSRLFNLDAVAGSAPPANPFRIGGAPAADPNSPTLVKTQTIDPQTGSPFAAAGAKPPMSAYPAGPEGPGTSMVTPRQQPPREGSYDAKPWTPVESVRGQDIVADVAAAGRPPAKQLGVFGDAVLPSATPNAAPAMPYGMAPPQQRPPAGMFDTTPPRAPGAPPPVQDAPTTSGSMWDTLKGGMNTAQERLKGVPTNPMAQFGLALASAGYDGSNPYANIQKALGGMPGTEQTMAGTEKTRNETAQATKDAQIQALLAQLLGQGDGQEAGMRQSQGQARVIR